MALVSQGTAAVPVSMRLPEAVAIQSIETADGGSDTFSPTGIRDRGELLQDQVLYNLNVLSAALERTLFTLHMTMLLGAMSDYGRSVSN